jgi:hypothetical protein
VDDASRVVLGVDNDGAGGGLGLSRHAVSLVGLGWRGSVCGL